MTIILVTSSAPTILIVDSTAKERRARKVSSRNLTFTPLDSAISLLKIIKTRSLYEERKNIKTTIRIKNNNLILYIRHENIIDYNGNENILIGSNLIKKKYSNQILVFNENNFLIYKFPVEKSLGNFIGP